MERKRQNLILFFEENENEKDISSTLVFLYMNRFIICEEDQTEILGVYNLAKPKENIPLFEEGGLEAAEEGLLRKTQFWKDNQTKLEHDKSVFDQLGSEIESKSEKYKAALKAFEIKSQLARKRIYSHDKMNFEHEINDYFQWLWRQFTIYSNENTVFHPRNQFHFIIGSSFYVSSSWRRRKYVKEIMRIWIDEIDRIYYKDASECFRKLVSAIFKEFIDVSKICNKERPKDELKKLEDRLVWLGMNTFNIQALMTILRGCHSNLLTKEQLKSARSENEVGSNDLIGKFLKAQILINDDLEEFHKFTTQFTGNSNINDFNSLVFCKQLTDSEVEKVKPLRNEMKLNFNEHFGNWSCFQTQNWSTLESLEGLILPLLEKTNFPLLEYLQCDCQRHTFYNDPDEIFSLRIFH